MKVLLLTPPFIHNIKYPLLGIPCLSAFLKTKGHQVWQRDININYLDRIISNNQFYKILRNIQLMFNSLNDKDALTYFEQRDLITLSNYITKGSYLNKCLKVKFSKAQKDEKIPDWEAIIETVLKIVYAEAMGTSIGSYGKLIKRSIKDIIEIIKTRYNTFFGKYLTDYIEAEVNQLQPDVIGVSLLCSDQLAASLMIAETIKNKYPHIKVFLGGSYFTSIQKSISNDQAIFDFVDGVIVGEGEYPLSNILAKIQKNEPLTGIPNLFTKNSNAQNELFYGDINNYPEPDYDGIEFDKYTSPNTFPFYTSKGCAWNKCAFCATQEAGNYREKELKVVFDEITRLQEKYQIESIVFNEIIENNRIEAIARYLIDNSINIKWSCKTRFSKNMTESFFELVKRSNNSSITMELESGSSRILQDINKGVDNDTIDFVFKNCEKANHELSINLFTGFPTETKSEAEQTLYYPEKVFKQYPDLKIHFNTHFAKIERNSRFLKNGKKSSVKILANNNLLTTVDWIRPYWVKDVTFNSGKLIVNNRGDFSEEQQSYKLNDILFELKPEKKKLVNSFYTGFNLVSVAARISQSEKVILDYAIRHGYNFWHAAEKLDAESPIKNEEEKKYYITVNKYNFNLPAKRYRVSQLVYDILPLCNGYNTLSTIYKKAFDKYKADNIARFEKSVLLALNRLYTIGAITVRLQKRHRNRLKVTS